MGTVLSPRQLLERLYRAMIVALQPAVAVADALDTILTGKTPVARLHLLAIGKAASAMTRAAQRWCTEHGILVIGGLSISHAEDTVRGVAALSADHPMPGAGSRAAAYALGRYVDEQIGRGERVIVLLSGGASALIGAARDGIAERDYMEAFAALLDAGLSIDDMNHLRRRISRWGGGRLGAALQSRGALVNVLAISDVIGDDPAMIGSGPCVPDTANERDIELALERGTFDSDVRARLRAMLLRAPDPSAPVRATPIPHDIVSSNIVALESLRALAAAEPGAIDVRVVDAPMRGNAHASGAMIAHRLLHEAQLLRSSRAPVRDVVVCWGGEPTVSVPRGAPAGGRMQALSLAAAKVLHEAGVAARGISLLAAGTDGRDGSTDAAGAIVDATTWHAIATTGRDPETALATLRSSEALRAADALLPAFVSGTNVNDVVVGMVRAGDVR